VRGPEEEDPDFLSSQLITCIGNKRSLLTFIESGLQQVMRELGSDRISFLDLFAGSGVVSRMAKRYSHLVIANDLERYAQVTSQCYLTNESDVDRTVLENDLSSLERSIESDWSPGFICELYAPEDEQKIATDDRVFYTRRNATYIDTARRAIDQLPPHRRHLFLAPLLSQASMHTNTSGVFKGFYKNREGIGQFGGTGRNALSRILKEIRLQPPVLSRFSSRSQVYSEDANKLVEGLGHIDVAYFDPPYNQHPYGSNYFMLNLICDYKRPAEISPVSGIPKTWKRSPYNRSQKAQAALFKAIEACKASFILISYNSEGFIPHDTFVTELERIGPITVFDTRYNTFRGSRNLHARSPHVTEFLYLIDKR
jgi:adenine-specific DNA-methyltransferase